jgi:hypothetical protein
MYHIMYVIVLPTPCSPLPYTHACNSITARHLNTTAECICNARPNFNVCNSIMHSMHHLSPDHYACYIITATYLNTEPISMSHMHVILLLIVIFTNNADTWWPDELIYMFVLVLCTARDPFHWIIVHVILFLQHAWTLNHIHVYVIVLIQILDGQMNLIYVIVFPTARSPLHDHLIIMHVILLPDI